MSEALEILSEQQCYGGKQGFYKHRSISTGTEMRFAAYLPPQASDGKVPVRDTCCQYGQARRCTENGTDRSRLDDSEPIQAIQEVAGVVHRA